MHQNRRPARTGIILACLVLVAPWVAAQSADDEAVSNALLPPDIEIESWGPARQTGTGEVVFEGKVTITWRDSRIQADRIAIRERRYVEAEGDVLVVWGGNRITGSRMSYDLETERGTLEEATGQVRNDYLFWARSAEKIGDETVRLKKATVTTCTQPLPYWSFSVSSATITVDGYARMWNVRLRGGRVPVFYLPYLVWPVKEDRALGLLMPEFQTTETRGQAVSQELFIPLGRSADLTLLGQYFTIAGFGGGAEVRFVPNTRGSGTFKGFYIDDKSEVPEGEGRYSVSYQQTQQFLNGFRMVADINLVSDFDYFNDFERKPDLVSSPSILARLEFSRNGKWSSMNVRELRREQLFADGTSLIQQTLPEIEWRGKSTRLGKSPVYLSYQSSLASIQQRGIQRGDPIDADYLRGDLYPTLSMPLSTVPWLDIEPFVSYRMTYYTQHQQQMDDGAGGTVRQVVDEPLTRTFWGGGLSIVGPKVSKVFDTPDGTFSKKYKHSIEPRLTYGYERAYERPDDIILYDEVDRFAASGNRLSYSLVQRLFAKRPRSKPGAATTHGESVVLPDGSVVGPDGRPQEAPGEESAEKPREEAAEQETLEPIEIASFEIRQSRSFDRDLSFADLDGDTVQEESSPYSRVELVGRFNPSAHTSLDLRGNYDHLFGRFSDVTLSGTVLRRLTQLRFSLVHREGLGVTQTGTNPDGSGIFEPLRDDTQLRLTTGFSLFRNKLRLVLDGTVVVDPLPGAERLPDKRWRIEYQTQCCTFLLERLDRNYTNVTARNDFYFRVDLTGIGKILDVNY